MRNPLEFISQALREPNAGVYMAAAAICTLESVAFAAEQLPIGDTLTSASAAAGLLARAVIDMQRTGEPELVTVY